MRRSKTYTPYQQFIKNCQERDNVHYDNDSYTVYNNTIDFGKNFSDNKQTPAKVIHNHNTFNINITIDSNTKAEKVNSELEKILDYLNNISL